MDLLDPLKRFIVVRRVPDLSILTHDHPLGSGTSHPHSGMNVLGVVAGRLTRQPPFPIAECRTIVSVTVPRATGNPIKSYLKIDRSSKNHFSILVEISAVDPAVCGCLGSFAVDWCELTSICNVGG